jgi:hypothetical protein
MQPQSEQHHNESEAQPSIPFRHPISTDDRPVSATHDRRSSHGYSADDDNDDNSGTVHGSAVDQPTTGESSFYLSPISSVSPASSLSITTLTLSISSFSSFTYFFSRLRKRRRIELTEDEIETLMSKRRCFHEDIRLAKRAIQAAKDEYLIAQGAAKLRLHPIKKQLRVGRKREKKRLRVMKKQLNVEIHKLDAGL